jgi:phosphoribosylaminoimidazolecarboxamide formyltransferase/IMP cyclohydrolase
MVNIVREVDEWVKVQHVLASVWDKTGLAELVPGLVDVNPAVRFYATGGTYRAIGEVLGSEGSERHLRRVSDYTGQPETQGGLVKTLDFKIYLGLLTETYNEAHQADLARTSAMPLDMVVVNLYPFEATVSRQGVTAEEARANIDIGGPCMLRAAAKNYLRVAPVVDPADYGSLLTYLREHGGALDLARRFALARKAFAHTAAYDAAICRFLDEVVPAEVKGTYPATDPGMTTQGV